MISDKFDYDLFVIGAGSGGVRAARVAASHGARVAIAEEYVVGGTCVVRGCIPKKLFVYASHFSENFKDAKGFGWTPGTATFNWSKLVQHKDNEIDRLNGIYLRNLKNSGVEIFETRAVLEDANTVRLLTSGQKVVAEKILIATGAWPFVPSIPGADLAITSNEAFHLDKLPQSITVIGGGYIAVEFAGIFNGLGVETTLIYRGEKILRGFDDDLRVCLQDEMSKKGITVSTNIDLVSVARNADEFELSLNDGSTMTSGLVMYATGRKPNTKELGLEKAGVVLGSNGEIIVDKFSQSSVPNIYAVGDVTDREALTPVAIREGHTFADTVFGNAPASVNYDFIPTAVFSQPEIGTVGMTEAQAREYTTLVDVYKSVFSPLKHTLSGSSEKMMMKLLVDGKSDRVLGCHIIGPDAGEMVQILGIALKMGATKKDFDATIALHPSSAEELVTMREKYHLPEDDPTSQG
jgi:glutathione reductase (NADPH)